MARKLLKRYLPTPDKIKSLKGLHVLGDWIHDPNLWHINRRSVSRAMFVGLFLAFVPLPSQMVLAAIVAPLVHCNLPLSIALVWITNPLTMPAIYYGAYLLGAWILQTPPQVFEFELSWHFLNTQLSNIGEPFLLGCFLCGLVFGFLGWALSLGLWRWYAMQRWQKRHHS